MRTKPLGSLAAAAVVAAGLLAVVPEATAQNVSTSAVPGARIDRAQARRPRHRFRFRRPWDRQPAPAPIYGVPTPDPGSSDVPPDVGVAPIPRWEDFWSEDRVGHWEMQPGTSFFIVRIGPFGSPFEQIYYVYPTFTYRVQ